MLLNTITLTKNLYASNIYIKIENNENRNIIADSYCKWKQNFM